MPRELTEEQRKDVEKIFKLMDRNKDGKITSKEFLTSLQVAGLNPCEDEAREIVAAIDTNNDGAIDRQEFMDLMKEYYNEIHLEREKMKAAFAIIDTNKDGVISLDELKRALLRPNSCIDEADVVELFEEIDKDKNGFIDYEEFVDSTFCRKMF